MEQDATINFANLNSRQLLEFEVSQLADGTLAAITEEWVTGGGAPALTP